MRLTSGRATNVMGANKNKKRSAQKNNPREDSMPGQRVARLLVGLSAAIAVLGMAASAETLPEPLAFRPVGDLGRRHDA